MALAEVATAVIQLVGIVMVSSELSSDHHLQAVFPPIPGPANSVAANVELHTASLVFPACDYVSSRGWPPMALELEGAPGMLYVRLNGEHITITAQPAGGRDELARQAIQASPRRSLPLPHLKRNCCHDSINLTTAFQPPYMGASAVVDFPSSQVQTAACQAAQGRMDTRVTITNGGTITIKAAREGFDTKEIVIKGSSQEIYLSHLPNWLFQTGPHKPHTGGTNHYSAYFAMTDAAPGQCNWECAKGLEAQPCPSTAYLQVVGTPEERTPKVAARTDLECSNSQWP